jgi:replication factor C small subunit
METNNNSEEFLWERKYQPTQISEFVGTEQVKAELQRIIKDGQVAHLMLHAKSPGTGKTSAAKLIAKSISCDYLFINASDENSIETVRTKIKSFASSTGLTDLKLIILDEFCQFSAAGQNALKSLIETHSSDTRFIFTCNYIEKIISAVLSRCHIYEIIPPSRREIAVHLNTVFGRENVTCAIDDLAYIVNTHYPDIRKMLNFSQQCNRGGIIKPDRSAQVAENFKQSLISLLKTAGPTAFKEIRQLVADQKLRNFDMLYQELYDKVGEYAPRNQTVIILIIAEYMYQGSLVLIKEISFMACIAKILAEINN